MMPMSLISLLLLLGLGFTAFFLIRSQSQRASGMNGRHDPAYPGLIREEEHTVRFLQFTLGAFFKITMLLSLVCGFCYGIFLSILGLTGGRVSVTFFGPSFRGDSAIIAAPIFSPLLFALFGCLCCLPAWWLTNRVLRRMKGLDLTGTIANTPVE